MKTVLYLILLCNSISAFAQKDRYIIVEEKPLFKTDSIGPFSLRTNHVLLSYKGNEKHTFNIYNLYFSRHNFEPANIDKNAFRLAYHDYSKLANDVLITVTPLTDSLNSKLTKLTANEAKKLNVISTEELLQQSVINLYKSFVKNEISAGFDYTNPAYIIKTYQYKLLIKKDNNYYRVNARTLTESYLVDEASYIYPNQYHNGEINTAPAHRTQYFNLKEVDALRSKYSSIDNHGLNFQDIIVPEKPDSSKHLYGLKFNTIPVNGIGSFYFYTGIGIINGSYDYFFNGARRVNNDRDFEPGKILLEPQTINGLTLKEFNDTLKKKYPSRIIIEL